MKQSVKNIIISGTIATLVIVILFIVFHNTNKKGTLPIRSYDNNEIHEPMDSLYLKECDKINSYRKGIVSFGKKKMILSSAAKLYYKEEVKAIDSTLPVVDIIFFEDYKGYEVYWIVQGSPMNFSFSNSITDVECMGDFVVMYCLKDQHPITYEDIRQLGFNDQCTAFTIRELSWFLMIDPTTMRHIIVKNAMTREDCIPYFDDFVQNKNSELVITCVKGN